MSDLSLIWLFPLCLLAALLAQAALNFRRRRPRGADLLAAEAEAVILLFDDDQLLDATARARALLAGQRGAGPAWGRFVQWARPHFPDIDQRFARLPDDGRFTLRAAEAGLVLVAEWRSGIRHVTIHESARESTHKSAGLITTDSLLLQSQEGELRDLRLLVDEAPLPIWREDAAGAVIWANPAYLALAAIGTADPTVLDWPLPALPGAVGPGRVAITLPGALPDQPAPRWFDCRVTELTQGRIVFALPADAAVAAESSLAAFVQTLTKTFAQLPIGLAIFDRQRRLQLFNPALSDLTGLAPEFLSARPTLFAVLDALRENKMIPEPRDYKHWRGEMAALERTASDGLYEDTWVLPSGQTWRVSGRPHPEGALALLFEDISAEITRTRRMRADLELGQAVIDTMDEAIAVFSPAGQLLMSNRAYGDLWGHDPSTSLADQGLADLLAYWRAACAPTRLWDEISAAGGRPAGDRVLAPIHCRDGRTLGCRVTPLAGGAMLIGFALAPGGDIVAGDTPALRPSLAPAQPPSPAQPALASG